MKSPVIVSSNSDSGSSSADLEVSLAIDQSHQMRVSDKGGASSSRSVRADHVNDDRCVAIVGADGQDTDRLNINRDLSIEESEDQELEEQALPEFAEEVDGGDLAIDLPTKPSRGFGEMMTGQVSTSESLALTSAPGLLLKVSCACTNATSTTEGCGSRYLSLRSSIARLDALRFLNSPVPHTATSAILTMAAELGRSVNLAQLEEMVGIAKSGDCGRFYASMRSGCMILTGAGRSEKRKDREDDRRHSGADSKSSKKERRKNKALVVPEVANVECSNLEERNAEGDDYDFNLRFAGRGRPILEDPVACGEYVRYIQGHPRGAVPESDEMVERDEFLAFSVDLTKMVSNANFMRTRYEGMLQKNHELIMENRGLKSRMKNMTIAAEEKVGRILALEQKNEELTVEAAKWEDEVQSMIGEKESIYHLAKSQMKRLRVSRSDTATNFGEYAIEKVGTELWEKVEAKFEKIRRHIADSKKMNHISSTVGQIKAFLSFYEEQGSAPEGAVERLQEDLEKYLKMAAAHDVEKISEEDFTFSDRASWIPGEELVFPIETPNRIGQYGLGEEWDSSGEEEVRGGGEVDPRSSRVTLRVGGSDPIVSLRGRERGNGSGSSHVSETDKDEGPLGVDGRAKNVEHPPEVAGAPTRAAEGPSMAADPVGGPVVTPEVPGIDDIDVVNF
ncbi:hypothetical protein AALP_AA6G060000 [Arabis alpina]|uniref:Uncharacterized protein n=1 Tax=Arabis alpina TaxID=50452 RepID=A0A087GMD7_ARAAL|nr:hypothetical protein AALP_AA6G060000 [Arabis alpina]